MRFAQQLLGLSCLVAGRQVTPPPPPQIGSVVLLNSNPHIQMTISSSPGLTFSMKASTNLLDWTPIARAGGGEPQAVRGRRKQAA